MSGAGATGRDGGISDGDGEVYTDDDFAEESAGEEVVAASPSSSPTSASALQAGASRASPEPPAVADDAMPAMAALEAAVAAADSSGRVGTEAQLESEEVAEAIDSAPQRDAAPETAPLARPSAFLTEPSERCERLTEAANDTADAGTAAEPPPPPLIKEAGVAAQQRPACSSWEQSSGNRTSGQKIGAGLSGRVQAPRKIKRRAQRNIHSGSGTVGNGSGAHGLPPLAASGAVCHAAPAKPVLSTEEREVAALQPFLQQQRRRDERVREEVRTARKRFLSLLQQRKAELEARVRVNASAERERERLQQPEDTLGPSTSTSASLSPGPERDDPREAAATARMRSPQQRINDGGGVATAAAAESKSGDDVAEELDLPPCATSGGVGGVVAGAVDEEELIFAASCPSRALEEDRILGRHAREQFIAHRRRHAEEQERELRFVKDRRVVARTLQERLAGLPPSHHHHDHHHHHSNNNNQQQQAEHSSTHTFYSSSSLSQLPALPPQRSATCPPPSEGHRQSASPSFSDGLPHPRNPFASNKGSRGTASSGYGALIFVDGAVSDFLLGGEIRRSRLPDKFLAVHGRRNQQRKKAFHF